MSKTYKRILVASVIMLIVLIVNGDFVFETTEELIVEVDKILISYDYIKMDNHDIFSNDYEESIDSQNNIWGISFDLEKNYIYIKLEEKIKEQWIEYSMIGYSYSDNVYSISYYRKNDEGYLRRLYLYSPDESDDIELVVSDFDGDFYAETDYEKKIYFEKTKNIFNDELSKMNLTIEDLILWNENN